MSFHGQAKVTWKYLIIFLFLRSSRDINYPLYTIFLKVCALFPYPFYQAYALFVVIIVVTKIRDYSGSWQLAYRHISVIILNSNCHWFKSFSKNHRWLIMDNTHHYFIITNNTHHHCTNKPTKWTFTKLIFLFLNFYAFIVFRKRGFIFRKTVVFTGMVFCVLHASVCTVLYVEVCVCVCVFVRERVCVCVCVFHRTHSYIYYTAYTDASKTHYTMP